MQPYHISLEHEPSPEDIQTVQQNLEAYNTAQIGYLDARRLAVFFRDEEGQIVGGLVGWTYWDWLGVNFLWVREDLRNQGYGRQLLQAAEDEARERGCRNVLLDTFDFQAPDFYRKMGYEIFGVLDDFAGKYERIYFRKSLV